MDDGGHDDHDQHDEERGATRPSAGRGHDGDRAQAAQHPASDGASECSSDLDHRGEDRPGRAGNRELGGLGEVVDAELVGDANPSQVIETLWSGQLPHPEDLERYEALHPGITGRILDQKDRQLEVMEVRARTVARAVDAEANSTEILAAADRDALKRGQYLSWSIALAACVIAIVGLVAGQAVALVAIIVPAIQVASRLVRTVTDGHAQPVEAPSEPE